jgi:cholesterol oxidase
MYYRLPLSDGEGHPLTLVGHKVVEDDPGLDLWTDTTTLFTRVLSGHVETDAEQEQAGTIAVGILHIHPLDFAKQLTTFRARPVSRVDAVARFGALFAGDLWDVYRR